MTKKEQDEEEFEKWLISRFPHPYNLFRTDKKEILKETWLASRRLLREQIDKQLEYVEVRYD